MQAHAIKYKDGWFIRDLPELSCDYFEYRFVRRAMS